MSAREEQPATVPPPAGEDDAYNAATKVGAMPAEVMARLRAEGLLPEEESVEPSPATTKPPTPRTALAGQDSGAPSPVNSSAPPTPRVIASPLPDLFGGEPLPILHSEDHYGETGLPQINLETPINELKLEPELPAASSRPPIPVIGGSRPPLPPPPRPSRPVTPHSHPPIGFPSVPPPSGSGYPAALQSSGMQVPSMSQVPPPPPISEPALQREIRAFGGTRLSKAQRVIVLVAVLGLVVAFAFLMALLSQRR